MITDGIYATPGARYEAPCRKFWTSCFLLRDIVTRDAGQEIKNRVGGYVGLAARARLLVSGGAICRRALNSGKGHLIVLAEDVSEPIRTRFTGLSHGKNVPMIRIGTKEDLGGWVGKSARSALLIQDVHLAKAILQVKQPLDAKPPPLPSSA